MKKHFKLILVLLALALAVSILAVTATASESEAEPTLSIKSFSVSLENAVYMNFKVAGTGIEDSSNIKLLLWKNAPEEYKKGSEDVVLSTAGTEAASGYEVFKYTDVAAKQMTEYVYVCAYASEGDNEVYSSPAKLSIVMYAYMQKNAANPDAALVELIDGMLEYGALAQTYFKYNTEFLANEATYQIRVKNGLLEDNFSLGWYFEGQGFTLTANPAPEGYTFSHWENSAGENIGETEVLPYTATKVDTYTAVYEEFGSSEGLEFVLNDDGESYTVTGIGTCTDTDIVIGSYNGLPVTKIANGAFTSKSITSVTIKDCVTSIDNFAFFNCAKLASVTIGDGVEIINDYVFSACTSLAGIEVDSDNQYYKSIDGDLYSKDGRSLIQYAIAKTATSFTLAESVTAIEHGAFAASSSLTSITIPDSVTSIGNYVFAACTSLVEISVNSSNYVSIDGNLYSEDGKTLIQYATGKTNATFTVPEGVESIRKGAFAGCASITNVNLPNTVTDIGDYAFAACIRLISIIIPDSVATVGPYTFFGCANLTIYCEAPEQPSGWNSQWNPSNCPVVWGYSSLPVSSEGLEFVLNDDGESYTVTGIGTCTDTDIVIGSYNGLPVTAIANRAFQQEGITGVTIGNSVTTIGDWAFWLCGSLTSVTVPDSVTTIGELAFARTGLASVTIPASVTTIGSQAFDRSASLANIEVSADNQNYKSIDGNLYSKDGTTLIQYAIGKAETSFAIPDSVTSIGYSAFGSGTSLTSVTMSDSVITIGDYAFYDCTSLTSVTIGDSVITIGIYAFWDCTSLASITISNNVTAISDSAFRRCTSLTSVTIGNSVTTIDDYAFSGCTSLASVTIPTNVATIGKCAFYSCSSLTSVTIPDSVKTIGGSAFRYCTSLANIEVSPDNRNYKSIDGNLYSKDGTTLIQYAMGKTATAFTISSNVTTVGELAFDGCASLESVIIPDSVATVGYYAIYGCANLTIYCEAPEQPSGWNSQWNPSNCPVVWGYSSLPVSSEGLEFVLNDDGESYTVTGIGTCTDTDIVIGSYNGLPVTAIANRAFQQEGITSVTIGNSVTTIGGSAFNRCTSLANIEVSADNQNYKSIDGNLYSKDGTTLIQYAIGKADTEFTVPDSVTTIGSSAFLGCTSLTSVIIPDSVTTIGNGAFLSCTSLASVTIGNSVTTIGSYAFWNCTSLANIEVSADNQNYKSIDGNLYSKDGTTLIQYAIGKADTEFTVPDSVTTIGNGAFKRCTSLTSVIIPDSVTTIGSYAFESCTSLTSIIIPDSVATVGYYAFYGCTNLTIYCEAPEQPSGWSSQWNPSNCPVVWGYVKEGETIGGDCPMIPIF